MHDAESSIAIILAMGDYGDKLQTITNLIEEIKQNARNTALEEAAQALVGMANNYPKDTTNDYYDGWKKALTNGIGEIRALKEGE